MGIHLITMPDIGEGIAEVELVQWHVQPGDVVAEDQVLADVMTDKATVQVPSPVEGTVLSLGGKVGDVMAVGADLIRITVQGQGNVHDVTDAGRAADAVPVSAVPAAAQTEDLGQTATHVASQTAPGADLYVAPDATSSAQAAHTATESLAPNPNASASASFTHPASAQVPGTYHGRAPGEKPTASPAVRRQAWDMGIDLRFVRGTGPQGRILREDLQAYVASAGTASASEHHERMQQPQSLGAQDDGTTAIAVVGLRRRIAQKMQESKRHIPHFSYVEEIDVTEVEALRAQMNAQWGAARGKLTLLPFLVRAMVLALREFPHINARYDDDAQVVTQFQAVHLGVATQSDSGLMVPVLRHAQSMDVWQCAREITRLAQAARAGRAAREELSGSTITLSSLGALGGIVATPIINHPEVAIVGVNRMVEKPVVRDGAVVVRKTMNLSSSFDHRVVDGMHAAQFIQAMRRLLECPALLFVA